jgi:hypothetical protein
MHKPFKMTMQAPLEQFPALATQLAGYTQARGDDWPVVVHSASCHRYKGPHAHQVEDGRGKREHPAHTRYSATPRLV